MSLWQFFQVVYYFYKVMIYLEQQSDHSILFLPALTLNLTFILVFHYSFQIYFFIGELDPRLTWWGRQKWLAESDNFNNCVSHGLLVLCQSKSCFDCSSWNHVLLRISFLPPCSQHILKPFMEKHCFLCLLVNILCLLSYLLAWIMIGIDLSFILPMGLPNFNWIDSKIFDWCYFSYFLFLEIKDTEIKSKGTEIKSKGILNIKTYCISVNISVHSVKAANSVICLTFTSATANI